MNFKDVKTHLSKGEVEKAIELLIQYSSEINDNDLQNYIIATSARFRIYTKNWYSGVELDKEEERKIVLGLLHLVDEVENRVRNNRNLQTIKNHGSSLRRVSQSELFEKFYDLTSVFSNIGKYSDEEIQEAYMNSVQLKQLMYDEIDSKLKVKYPDIIFNRLFYSDSLMEVEVMQIRNISSDSSYKWYEKSIVVSALTLSLVKKFEPQKIELLMDFLLEFEHNVWQRALVGLFFAIYNRENLLLLYPGIIRKLGELKGIARVRNGLESILLSVKTVSHKHYFDSFKEYCTDQEYDFFKNPKHWFLPFFFDNPVIKEEISHFPNVKNIHKLPELLYIDPHLSNSQKYAILLSVKRWDISKVSSLIDDLERSSLCTRNHEYDLYIRDIFAFYSHFSNNDVIPKASGKDDFLEPKLLDYLLSKKNKLFLKAELLRAENSYDEAITAYQNYCNEFKEEAVGYCRLGEIYEKMGQLDEAIQMHKKAFEVDNLHLHSFFMLAYCYMQKEEFENVKSYLDNFLNYTPEDLSDLECLWVGIGYVEFLKDTQLPLPYLKKASQKNEFKYSHSIQFYLSIVYAKEGKFRKAKKHILLANQDKLKVNKGIKTMESIIQFLSEGAPEDFDWGKYLLVYFDDSSSMIDSLKQFNKKYDLIPEEKIHH